MSTYAMSYDEIGAVPYSRFEELWTSYSTRVALAKLDEEVARQRSVIQGAMAESNEIQNALDDLGEREDEARRAILHPELLEQGDEKVATTADGNFRSDKWWKTDSDPVATAPVQEKEVQISSLDEVLGEDTEGELDIEVEMEE